ncbi:hypothetical protein EDL96_05745 [Kocuria soli]|uniref:Terminase n=1 Tax=Kocuria soli TaxID=2485125 RepID=A0A3N3ZV10_9MICC|nr:hypothetical protein EDL96_05745 [Kocuria soli]
MDGRKAPRAPEGLATSGKKLWKSIVDEHELEEHELLTLREACRVADRLDTLFSEAEANPVTVLNARGDQTVHPALVEARQQGALYVKLIASLRIPDAEDNQPQRRGGARGAYGLRVAAS